MKQYIFWGAAAIAVLLLASNSAAAETTQDHYKDVYHKTPHTVEVCYDKQVSGDKTGDTIKGAILGGIIGNNVGDIETVVHWALLLVVCLDIIIVMRQVV